MSKSKQATLLQSWGNKADKKSNSSQNIDDASRKQPCNSGTGQVIDLCDEVEDEDLLLAMEESLKDAGVPQQRAGQSAPHVDSSSRTDNQYIAEGSTAQSKFQRNGTNQIVQTSKGTKQQTLFSAFGISGRGKDSSTEQSAAICSGVPPGGVDDFNETIIEGDRVEEEDLPDVSQVPDMPGFDKVAGRMWIYPTNYPVRQYQFSIVREALYKNTLVVLPTGLGKTFIAAVVMYNFYRWYPQGKVVFMAPTKPLVAQQIEACYNIMGIPQTDTAEMTGAMQPPERKKSWLARRVFFLTPQVMMNDLSRGAFPASNIKCLVVDEAHKATGNHAYCQVVRELINQTDTFRVLALSATPGSDIKAVQQVMNNLLVSHIELKSEESADIQPYTHARKVDKIVVPLGEELTAVREQYLRILEVLVRKLRRAGVLYNREAKSLSKFLILKAREQFRQNPPENLQRTQFGAVEGDFALAMSLYHGYELLQQHGLRSLFNFLEALWSGDKGFGRTRAELQRNGEFCNLMDNLRSKFDPIKAALPFTQESPRASQLAKPLATGHPKMKKLEEVVLEHFLKFQEQEGSVSGSVNTRIMIFSQYRDSVSEITEVLNRHRPLVKVMSFIGQSSAGKSTRGFTQKEQLKVMRLFREGGYNTLVSTCVGEEGLDIGDVDLIICFDAHKSPIRLVQRMGRTGRKREGRIVMLVTQGKEEQIYNQSQYSKRSIHKAIQNGTKSLVYYQRNQRMVPQGLQPVCHKMHITVNVQYQAATRGRLKPTNTVSTTSGQTSNMGRKKSGVVKKDGFLTEEELAYWAEHYEVKGDVPTLPSCAWVTIKENTPIMTPGKRKQRAEMSLTDWTPWQNRLQDTHTVDHSMQSRHLVELMEFMSVQEAIGEEDNYGMEMQLYLNREDVFRASQRNPPGILRFCTPGGTTSKIDSGAKRKTGEKNKGEEVRKRKRRSEQLPGISSDEEGGGTESEEDLPEFGGMMRDKHRNEDEKRKTRKRRRPCEDVPSDMGDAVSGPSTVILEGEEEEKETQSVIETDLETRLKSKTGKKKKKLQNHDDIETIIEKDKTTKDFSAKMRKNSKNDSTKSGKRRKRKRTSMGEKSVIAVIADIDEDDFEDVQPSHTETEDIVSTGGAALCGENGDDPDEGVTVEHLDVERGEDTTMENCDDLVEGVDLNRKKDIKCDINILVKAGDNRDKEESSSEEDTEICDLLPLFTSQKLFKFSQKRTVGKEENVRSVCAVRTPPSVKELRETMQQLDQKGRISPLDILSLVDKWEEEKRAADQEIIPDRSVPTEPIHRCNGQKVKVSVPKMDIKVPGLSGVRRQDKVSDLYALADINHSVDLGTNMSLIEPDTCHEFEPFENYKSDKQHSSKDINGNPKAVSQEVTITEDKSDSQSRSEKSLKVVVSDPKNCEREEDNLSDASSVLSDVSTGSVVFEGPRASQIPRSQADKDILFSPTLAQPRSLIPSNTSTPLIAPSSQRLSQRETHHSFFSKDCDDSLLGLVSTPRSGANHGRISPCHTASVSCHTPTLTKPDAKPNTSQIGIAKTNTSHLRSSQQHVSMAASPKFASSQRGLSSVTSQGSGRQGCVAAGDSMDVSVLTFTQCLAAVHTSMDANSSQDISHTSHTTKTSPSMDASQDISHTSSHTTTTSPNMERKPLAQSENINVNQGVKNRSGEENTNRRQETLLNQNSHQVEEPQFDLGFDFDDFDDDDDDMVIPPSPEAQNTQPFSQRSLSARRNLSLNKSFGQNVPSSQGDKMNKKTPKIVSTEVSYNLLELDFDEPFECEMETEDDLETVRSPSLLDSNTKETPIARPNTGDPKPGAVWGVGSRDPNAGTLKTGVSTNKSPLMKKPLQHENSLDDKKALSDSVTGDDFFKLSDKSIYHAENVINEAEFLENVLAPRRSQSPPVAVVTPVISNIIDKKPGCSQKNIFDLGDSLDIDAIDWGETLEEGKPKDKKSAEDRTSSAELEQIENDIVDGEYEDEDLDESVINMPRRKKKRAVLLSPCSQEVATHVLPDTTSPDFKTPCRPAPRSNKHHKRKAVLISDDEDEDSPVVHRNASRQKPLRDMKFSSDEDDDDFEDTRRAGVFTSRSKYDHHPKQKDISNKRKNNGVRCGFLEVEAELSGDEESEDDEDGSDLDQYDASFIQDATQASQLPDESVDMQAVYMQAVRSPVGGSGRFKLQYNYDPNIDVYSQRPPEEHSEYMQDSFCVGDDYSEYFEDEDDSFVVRDDEISYVRTDKNRRGKNKGKKSGKSGGKPVKGKKRIVRMCESSSEEDEKKVIDIVEEKAWKQSHRKPSKKLSSDSASSDHEKIGANREHSDTGWLRSSNKKSSEKSAPISSSGTSGSLVVPGTSQTASLTMRCQNKLASKTGKTHKLSSVSKSDNSNSSQVTSSITSESHKEKYLKVSQKASFNTRDSQNYSPTGLTQMPSLASRCRTNINQGQKQNHMETSENNDLFSLGVNDFLSDEEVFEDQILSHTQKNQSISKDFTLCDNNFTNIVPTPGNLTGKISANLSRKSDNVCNKIDRSIYGNTSLAGAPMNAANQKAERLRLARAPMNAANQKAERLRLAKLKQEECRRKLQAQAVTSSNMSASTSSLSISRLPNTRSSTNETPSCKLLPKPGPSTVSPPTLGLSSSTITKYSPAQKCGVKRVVFADSREINSAQDIVSLLRSRHGFQVEVRQLSSCDYVVSNRMAIERKSVSDFMNGANRMKLLDRLRHMCEQYERPCLIVEKDRVKLGEEKSVKPILRTKYIDTVVCSLAHTAIKVFYTNSQEETANVMAELVKLEERKGMCVGVPVNISPQQEQVLKLYTSLPRVSYVTALNLLHGFRTIKDFMQTSPNLMAKRGHMSDSRAQEVYNYIRHHFDPQMMAIRKK